MGVIHYPVGDTAPGGQDHAVEGGMADGLDETYLEWGMVSFDNSPMASGGSITVDTIPASFIWGIRVSSLEEEQTELRLFVVAGESGDNPGLISFHSVDPASFTQVITNGLELMAMMGPGPYTFHLADEYAGGGFRLHGWWLTFGDPDLAGQYMGVQVHFAG